MKRLFVFAYAMSALALGKPTAYYNGLFFPDFKSATPIDGVLVVENGKVVSIGKPLESKNNAIKIDLKGRVVLPAFTDAHAHLLDIGKEKFEVDLRGTKTPEEAASRVKTFLKEKKLSSAAVIVGNGWDQSNWPEQKFPHRSLLDDVSRKQSILLYRIDGHAAWVNTQALMRSGIWKNKADPQGGKVIKDKSNAPTGILIDSAMDPLASLSKKLTPEEIERYLRTAVEKALSLGITSIHDAGISPDYLPTIKKLITSHQVPFRVYEMLSSSDLSALKKALATGPDKDSEGRYTVRAVKYFADGAMGSRGAAFETAYEDDPGNNGLLITPEAQMIELFKEADAKGFQIAVHAIGDRGNHLTVKAMETALGKTISTKRPRLEHAQAMKKDDIKKAGELGIIASMQPVHCTSDMKWVVDRIGKNRARYTYAWRSFLNAKARLAFGSDSPVEALNPFPGLYAAVTRQTIDSTPENGFVPEEKITLQEAFQAFTEGAAYASFQEDTLGTLTEGKWADFIIVDSNPFEIPLKELHDLQVRETYLAGEKVWERK